MYVTVIPLHRSIQFCRTRGKSIPVINLQRMRNRNWGILAIRDGIRIILFLKQQLVFIKKEPITEFI